MTSIYIYDDNKARRESLIALISLQDHLKFVGSSSNCNKVEQDMKRADPDVVLMDIEMPQVNGIEGVKRICKAYPHIKVIMQTVYEDTEKIFQCLQFGAKGYILKKASITQHLDCIESVIQGGAFMTPSVAIKVINYFQHPVNIQDELDSLTNKENEVLRFLADGHSYKSIGDKMNITAGTVNNHLKKIYEKLQVHTAVEAVSKLLRIKTA